jgi:hypothetical protein
LRVIINNSFYLIKPERLISGRSNFIGIGDYT